MSGVIYLMHGEGQLVPMREESYNSEDILQRLLADYPDLLGGEQMNASAPRRWLLLAREAGLPSEEAGGDRWSVDHLFVDQDGIPTIIEVKRSTDSRIRREVVGQMLDYAANAIVYWPVERLRSRFESMCESQDRDPESAIVESLGVEGSVDDFWKLVQTNLQAGRVRLIFVADIIPPELRRIVEFLNQQMNPAEVLAVEVRQYAGQGQQALVPRVIGQTQQAVSQKATSSSGRMKRQWDETSFIAELASRHGQWTQIVVASILAWSEGRTVDLAWGSGVTDGTLSVGVFDKTRRYSMFIVYTSGKIEIQFGRLAESPSFADEGIRRQLMRQLNEIDDVKIGADRIDRYPSFPIQTLANESSRVTFLKTFDWVIDEIRVT